jgi:hypothetical protein
MSGSFVPDLSIIDMLANLGPSSMGFITECAGAIPVR